MVAWAGVSAMVSRWGSGDEFAELSVVRGAMTLLTYVSLGFVPVLLRRLLEAYGGVGLADEKVMATGGLGYERGVDVAGVRAVYSVGATLMLLVALAGALLVVGSLVGLSGATYSGRHFVFVVGLVAGGMWFRVLGDIAGAAMQSRGRLAVDNLVNAGSELAWPAGLVAWHLVSRPPGSDWAESAGAAFLLSGLLGMMLRHVLARMMVGEAASFGLSLERRVVAMIAPAAAVLVVGHLADFLYAPVNQVLIAGLRSPGSVAAYAPALQIDGALLLLTSSVGAVLLPRVTGALVAGDVGTARRLYVAGTVVCGAVLAAGAGIVVVFRGPILRGWLGAEVAAEAYGVLPWVLVHTVIGGTAGIGRAVLLGAGKYRAYAGVALGFGVVNAAGAAGVLVATDWGVRGVAGVTIVTVLARCGVWMPWYTLRTLREMRGKKGVGGGLPMVAGGL